jgi:membrane protein required for colicin V production
MNLLDLIIAVILLFGAIRGFQRGFFYEAATLVALVAGVFIAILFANIAGTIINELVNWNIQLVKIIAFVIIFVIVVGLIKMLGHLLTKLFKAMLLGFINKLAGFALGLVKWIVLLSILFAVLDFFDEGRKLLSDELLSGSFLYIQLEKLNILHYISENLPDSVNVPGLGGALAH